MKEYDLSLKLIIDDEKEYSPEELETTLNYLLDNSRVQVQNVEYKLKVSPMQWQSYLKVQKSGEQNMWGATVPFCSRDAVLYIIKNYALLEKVYGGLKEDE